MEILCPDLFEESEDGCASKSPCTLTPTLSSTHDRTDWLQLPQDAVTPCPSASPSCLSVPGVVSYHGNAFDMGRRTSSITSSIFDLSYEGEVLDRAIRDNDIKVIKKIIHVHSGKFPLVRTAHVNGGFPVDKLSAVDSVSYVSQLRQTPLPPGELPEAASARRDSILQQQQPRGSQQLNPWTALADARRESSATENTDSVVPLIFRNAVHVAIQHNALDVLGVLLASGVDPNEPGLNFSSEGRRCSSISEILLPREKRDVRFQLSQTSEVSPSDNSSDSPNCAKCDSVSRTDVGLPASPSAPASQGERRDSRTLNRTAAAAAAAAAVPTSKGALGATNASADFDFGSTYTAERLQELPPLFLAAAQRNVKTVRLLLQFGAAPNVHDDLGCTPLHLSACVDFQSWLCAVALLEYGAQVDAVNRFGVSPRHLSPDLQKEQQRIVDEHLFVLTRDSIRETPGSEEGVELASEHSKFVARWFRKAHINHNKKNRTHANGIERDAESTTTYSAIERDRASSVSSNKSKFSLSLRFSLSPPPSQAEDFEMDSRSPEPDFRVRLVARARTRDEVVRECDWTYCLGILLCS
ncbi:hypothetical protein CAPTEDRAFT_195646 [Capitella teleta]|uniref:Uncharacterized protein n=1 Tax=Capitella teleta TaxID=283909 RepID=X1ZVB6_CAPTE|nr:hypothetical protein CAPTEDRAFT_195646 [Capitella teleta]|eukprot:ELT88361.1 hypothetical protein CAPTEDRAFT_195646 [Capitella teleta]